MELIEDDNLTPEIRTASKIAYATDETRKIVVRQALKEGEKKGKKEGIIEGEKKGLITGKIETAKNMMAKGFDIQVISEITKLDVETLHQLETK